MSLSQSLPNTIDKMGINSDMNLYTNFMDFKLERELKFGLLLYQLLFQWLSSPISLVLHNIFFHQLNFFFEILLFANLF